MMTKHILLSFAIATTLLSACSSGNNNATYEQVPELNAKRSEAFLDSTAKVKGVTVTQSGLQYQVITPGKGEKPTASDQVEVRYTGRLTDGTVFDSSDNQPSGTATFGLSQVIPGWTEGLQLMSTGAKYRFYIPANLAYGTAGQGSTIGPNEALVFDVELVRIIKPETPTQNTTNQ